MSGMTGSRFGGGSNRGDGAWYDTMQVCTNGHLITRYAASQPEGKQDFCSTCGAKTITACAGCNADLRGHRHVPAVFCADRAPPPDYCIGCGIALPWQAAKLENMAEVLHLSGVSEGDIDIVKAALPDITRETPKSDAATLRVKAILKTVGKETYDMALKVVTDVASEYSKKLLGLDK